MNPYIKVFFTLFLPNISIEMQKNCGKGVLSNNWYTAVDIEREIK